MSAPRASADRIDQRSRSSITFEGGLQAPFHRWFRLTPSFSPTLVREWLVSRGVTRGQRVLDPFSGAGTTAIVCKQMGIDALAVEINPLLAFVGQTCIDWSPDPQTLLSTANDVARSAKAIAREEQHDPSRVAARIDESLPPIHNAHRWWRDDVLSELLALRHSVGKAPEALRAHLRLALADIVNSTANVTLGRLQLAFVDRSSDAISVFDPFIANVERMHQDLSEAQVDDAGFAEVLHADSAHPLDIEDGSINAIFTSPPYPNRYSYVWNTRPHLYLLEFFTAAREATDLDLRTIGGTWGTATSSLQKGMVTPSTNVQAIAAHTLESLHARSTLMGNYVTKYCNDLDAQLGNLIPKLARDAPVGYVVGNSESKGIMIETHAIVGDLFSAHGLRDIDFDVLRRRNSGAGLTEVTVSARK